jgi:predicted amidohydrolase
MASLTVALLQLRSPGCDPGAAWREGERACREAARLGADLALFPELWQVGYELGEGGGRLRELATDGGGPFVFRFAQLAAELGIAIAVTYLERGPGAPRDTCTVIDRGGRPVLTQAKVHTCDFGPEAALAPGDGFRAAELELACGPVRVGVMICFDREFPESARVLMLEGAEVMLVPNACPLTDDRVGQLRARAFENMAGVAMANYAAPRGAGEPAAGGSDGRSVAFSGVAFDAAGRARDHLLVEADRGESIHLATFDLDELRAYRRRGIAGDAYRKPGTYRALVEDRPAAVFARRDSRRGGDRPQGGEKRSPGAYGGHDR